jgi:hypothetical protein
MFGSTGHPFYACLARTGKQGWTVPVQYHRVALCYRSADHFDFPAHDIFEPIDDPYINKNFT